MPFSCLITVLDDVRGYFHILFSRIGAEAQNSFPIWFSWENWLRNNCQKIQNASVGRVFHSVNLLQPCYRWNPPSFGDYFFHNKRRNGSNSPHCLNVEYVFLEIADGTISTFKSSFEFQYILSYGNWWYPDSKMAKNVRISDGNTEKLRRLCCIAYNLVCFTK